MLAALVNIQVHVTGLVTATVIPSQEPIIQMTSLMHHSCTSRAGKRNPNQCSTYNVENPSSLLRAFCQFIIRMGCYNHIHNNGHTRCAYTPTWVETFYVTIATPWLHACQYIELTCMYVTCTLMINTTDSYGRVRMHARIYRFGVQRVKNTKLWLSHRMGMIWSRLYKVSIQMCKHVHER